jgi:hypothetical protein
MARSLPRPRLQKFHRPGLEAPRQLDENEKLGTSEGVGMSCKSSTSPSLVRPSSACRQGTTASKLVNDSMYELFVCDIAARIIQAYWRKNRERRRTRSACFGHCSPSFESRSSQAFSHAGPSADEKIASASLRDSSLCPLSPRTCTPKPYPSSSRSALNGIALQFCQ